MSSLRRREARGEDAALNEAETGFQESEYQRLRGELQAAYEGSRLPELARAVTGAAWNDLLARARMNR
jgi:hypothetical protein